MGIAYNTSIVRDGLVLHLDAANVKSYPGTGTVWNDVSGKNNHATLFNTPTFSNGIVSWDGTNQYAQVTANQDSLDFRASQTIIIWMRHSFTSGRKNPWDQAYGGYGTWTHEQGLNINYFYGDAGSNTTPYTALNSDSTPLNVWQMMCSSRDISTVRWFRNGVQTAVSSNPYADQPITAANIRIARGYAGYWQGDMSQVMAYNRALTATEVKQNFEAMRGRFGI